MFLKTIRLASRKSELALWQSHWVKQKLNGLGHQVELVLVDTQGDQNQQAGLPFRQLPGQGFFTKAVQDLLLAQEADVAVHSFKDLPSLGPAELEIAAVTQRADARDVLVVRPDCATEGLPLPLKHAVRVGTSAIRRQKQLAHLRPDLELRELRGNVPSRIEKLREGHYDAIVLAAAGIDRLELDLSDLLAFRLEPSLMVPAPAQGALALECRRSDYELASLLTDLHDVLSFKAVAAERGLMAMLQGGCQLALGAYASFEQGLVRLSAWYEGSYVEVEHPASEAAAMLAFEALGRPKGSS